MALTRRTPLERVARLVRKTKLRLKRLTPRRSERVEDLDYLAFVRTLPCAGCGGDLGVQAHHAGQHPLGRKASDDTAIPLDSACHDALHSARGKFADQVARRVWEAAIIKSCRGLWREWQLHRRDGTFPLSDEAALLFSLAWCEAKKAGKETP